MTISHTLQTGFNSAEEVKVEESSMKHRISFVRPKMSGLDFPRGEGIP